ncbi:MAG: nucleotide pyrophosphohydrolase [Christensenella sp.]|nr:nucleotide pyrophosphohydrolase [Christensenella sp.]
MDSLEELKQKIDQFNKERDWDKFHSPSNLAKSIVIEAGELMECFQWSDEDYNIEDVKEELADVMNYCIQLASKLNLDIKEIVENKLALTEKKYPVDKAKGVSTKYDKL